MPILRRAFLFGIVLYIWGMGLVTIASIMLLVSVFIVSATCIYLIVTHPDNKNTDTITITPPTAWWHGVHEMD